jgi:DNA-directed RNA polymerase specialized sigma24 family protein
LKKRQKKEKGAALKKQSNPPNFTFEDKHKEIDVEIKKRRGKWFLDSLAWFDFSDVEQIIRAHIFKKWDQWDQSRPLAPWINKIITNQMKNILRNNYSNFVRPCLNCPFNQSRCSKSAGINPGSLCGFTSSGEQDSECPLYSKWEKTKKSAYDIKMAVTIENHPTEIFSMQDTYIDVDACIVKLSKALELALPPKQYKIYDMLYIQHMEDEEVAKVMGYKTTEKGRKAGYKQLKNLKKIFKDKAIQILEKGEIMAYESAAGAFRNPKGQS